MSLSKLSEKPSLSATSLSVSSLGSCIGTTSSIDTYGYLYNSSGSQLAYNDDYNGLDFYISYNLTAGQTYYIKVRHYSSTGTGLYTFNLEEPIPDEYGDNMASAYTVQVGSINGRINHAGDSDWFSFVPLSTGYYGIGTISSIDTYGYLYNSSGSQLTSNDDYNSDTDFYFSYNLTAGQTYYIQLRHYSVSGTGSYTFYISLKVPPTLTATPSQQSTWVNTDISVLPAFTANGGTSITSKYYLWSAATNTPTSWNSYCSGNITQTQEGTWYLHLKASDNYNNIATQYFGPYKIDKTFPTAPTNLVSTNITNSSVSLVWTAATDINGVTGYKVYRNGAEVGNVTGTSYTDTGLTAGTYYYTVKAYDGANNLSVASNQLTLNAVLDSINLTIVNIGNKYLLNLNVTNISSFDGTYTLSFDPLKLQISDICAFTYAAENSTGAIAGTGITITSFSNALGQVQFTINKTIPQNKVWSGLLNIFKFISVGTGDTAITIN